MKTDHFVFFASYADALSVLSDEDFGRAVRALCHYAFTGEEPEYRSLSEMIFVRMAMPIVARERGAQPGNRSAAKKKAVPAGAAEPDETDSCIRETAGASSARNEEMAASAHAGDPAVPPDCEPGDKKNPGSYSRAEYAPAIQQDDVTPDDTGFPFMEIPFLRSETGSSAKDINRPAAAPGCQFPDLMYFSDS